MIVSADLGTQAVYSVDRGHISLHEVAYGAVHHALTLKGALARERAGRDDDCIVSAAPRDLYLGATDGGADGLRDGIGDRASEVSGMFRHGVFLSDR